MNIDANKLRPSTMEEMHEDLCPHPHTAIEDVRRCNCEFAKECHATGNIPERIRCMFVNHRGVQCSQQTGELMDWCREHLGVVLITDGIEMMLNGEIDTTAMHAAIHEGITFIPAE